MHIFLEGVWSASEDEEREYLFHFFLLQTRPTWFPKYHPALVSSYLPGGCFSVSFPSIDFFVTQPCKVGTPEALSPDLFSLPHAPTLTLIPFSLVALNVFHIDVRKCMSPALAF